LDMKSSAKGVILPFPTTTGMKQLHYSHDGHEAAP
jgi:hypothetical protein